ncbi:MAG: response regulator transcription factor [Firmicutes bacterium]|nr:response regulator transcription factor [Bacillota bacterium]
MANKEVITILLADDHQVVRRGLRALLSLENDIAVIGEASDGAEAVDLYKDQHPDVVLLDLQMKPVDGLTALRQLRALDPNARILILTSFVDAAHVTPAMDSGATGYLLKTAEPAELLAAIRRAVDGGVTYDPDAMRAMMDGRREHAKMDLLTQRELDVLRMIAKGRSNQEIADALFIGQKTVKTHVSNILSKLQVSDRTQAAVYALKNGWFEN